MSPENLVGGLIMKGKTFVVTILALLISCATPTPSPLPPTPSPYPEKHPLYLAIIWHQHQPLYYKDTETGLYTRPWVRVHATKDYYDMAAILELYPKVKVTFNLTPSLIRQLDDFAGGAKDIYWALAEKPAEGLTEEEKRFILQRFFDANWDRVIPRFPRYKELLDKRGHSADKAAIDRALTIFTVQDLRDLQVLFNLAWFDPDFLAQEPLKSLVEKGRGFSEEDKKVIFEKAREVIKAVIPKHKELQDKGQIEVTTSPYAHPILPLLYDANLAAVGNPSSRLPFHFSFPEDASAQLKKAVEIYEKHFERKPRGLWPSEGAVAYGIVGLVADAGFTWMASGEDVLAATLELGSFARDSQETVKDADTLYRPYYVRFRGGKPVAVLFRDRVISDKIAFIYSGMPGEEAAKDFIQRLRNIRQRLEETNAKGPHLVSVILDGENAWEWYENDGKEFLHALYRNLSEAEDIKTITPSEYLKLFPEQRELMRLWPGCWFSPDFDTWIGEAEENIAWNYLFKVRNFLAEYDLHQRRTASSEAIAQAQDYIYLAEGSDWFWWYGSDQDSGQDEYFDYAFRSLLKEVYRALGEVPPHFLDAPIIPPKPVAPTRSMGKTFTPALDGQISPEEWVQAGYYWEPGQLLEEIYYSFDSQNLYLRLESLSPWNELGPEAHLGVYISSPYVTTANPFSRLGFQREPRTYLGIRATHLAEVTFAAGKAISSTLTRADGLNNWLDPQPIKAGVGKSTLELAIPLASLGELSAGDALNLRVVVSRGGKDTNLIPSSGPLRIIAPELRPVTFILEVRDPEGDDHGPGSYLYPLDAVFQPKVFDLKSFAVGEDEEDLVFVFTFYGPVPNPWNSPINLSLQTLDVYIDVDPGAGTGRRLLLPGRNASLAKGYGWEYAIWVEGWLQQIWAADPLGEIKQLKAAIKTIVNPDRQSVTVRVPKEVFSKDVNLRRWAYVAAVLSQEGYPSPGVWRVRDVEKEPRQWRMGGAPDDTNHTRIVDLAWPEGTSPSQEEILSKYPPSKEPNMDKLGPDDFCQIPPIKLPK